MLLDKNDSGAIFRPKINATKKSSISLHRHVSGGYLRAPAAVNAAIRAGIIINNPWQWMNFDFTWRLEP
jgi:hypothetical protein